MTDTDPAMGSRPRIRRPDPGRTTPRRNILGVFSQRDGAAASPQSGTEAMRFSGPPPGAHPLGLPMEEDAAPQDRVAPDFDAEAMRAADGVVNRHIRDGAAQRISTDTSSWKRLSGLAGSIDPAEIADLARSLTQGYTAVAQSWVEMADKLREILSVQAAARAQGEAGSKAASPAAVAPALCILSSRRVTGRVQMFGAAEIATVHPLAPEAPGPGMITEVALADGQIDIHVPDSLPPGRYNGVCLAADATPAAVVTVTIPEPPPDAS